MIRQGMITLIAESPKARGVHDAPEETTRKVPCEIHSINLSLAAEARAQGMEPEMRIRLRHAFTYHGEKLAEFEGQRYKIAFNRPLENTSGTDLLLERMEGNAADPEEEPEEETATDPPAGETEGTETDPEEVTDGV